jgi:phosphate transport system substrate-binding protein
MRRIFFVCLAAVSTAAAAARQLTVVPSPALEPLMRQAAKSFEIRHPGTVIHTELEHAAGETPDIVAINRPLAPGEGSLESTTVGWNGAALIVNGKNPIGNLTRERVKDILEGRIRNWKEVGGENAGIQLVMQDAGPVHDLVSEFFGLRMQPPGALVLRTNELVINQVLGNPDAIGYVSMAVLPDIEEETSIHPLRLDGVEPNLATIKSGSYSLVRPLNLVTKKQPPVLAKSFIKFFLSPPGQTILLRKEFVPLSPVSASLRSRIRGLVEAG